MLVFEGGGYRLSVAAEQIDSNRFAALVERAAFEMSSGRPAAAAATLRDALDLWRGEPLSDVEMSLRLEAEAARLRDARIGAIEARIDADLACGRHAAAVAELDGLLALHPFRERLCGLASWRCTAVAGRPRRCGHSMPCVGSSVRSSGSNRVRLARPASGGLEQRPGLDWVEVPARGLAVPLGWRADRRALDGLGELGEGLAKVRSASSGQ